MATQKGPLEKQPVLYCKRTTVYSNESTVYRKTTLCWQSKSLNSQYTTHPYPFANPYLYLLAMTNQLPIRLNVASGSPDSVEWTTPHYCKLSTLRIQNMQATTPEPGWVRRGGTGILRTINYHMVEQPRAANTAKRTHKMNLQIELN